MPIPDANVLSFTKLADQIGGFTAALGYRVYFGYSVGVIGNVDGTHLALLVHGYNDNSGTGYLQGCAYIIFIDTTGTCQSFQKIALQGSGGFTATLDGHPPEGMGPMHGDVDGDGIDDFAMGHPNDDTHFQNGGAVYVVFLTSTGEASSFTKLASNGMNGFTWILATDDHFGFRLDGLGDLDGDGVPDLAVGANDVDDVNSNSGSAFVLFLDSAGACKSSQKISNSHDAFTGTFAQSDGCGSALANAVFYIYIYI